MKYFCAALLFLFSAPAQAEMDDLEFITELEALATTIALEETCSVGIDMQRISDFIPKHFAGKESKLVAEMDIYVRIAKDDHEGISDLQLNLVCASIQSYVAKHDLAPGT